MKQRSAIGWWLALLLLLTACGGGNQGPTGRESEPSTVQTALSTREPSTEACETTPLPPSTARQTAPRETAAPEPWSWSYGAPESQGMDPEALAALHKTYESFPLLSALILRNGVIVDSYYRDGYDESSVFTLQSVSKSITSALFGIALDQGSIESLDAPLSDYFPALLTASDSRWGEITLRHLLTHTSGIASTDSSIWYDWRSSENWLDYLFALPIYTRPGANFDYSTGNTHLLSAVLERATGKPLGDYAREFLFAPLGMDSAGLETAPEGVGDGGNGFSMTTLDLARFGLLYLQGGLWQDRQIVPAEWVEASTTTQARRASDGSRYGYQWWLRSFQGREAFVAQGHYGQYIIAVPELSLLLAINSNYEGSSSVYWQIANAVVAACGK